MYFRDPAGNQFEMYCPEGDTGIPLRIGQRAGGDYVIPFRTLVYADLGQPASTPPAIPMLGFDHMTLPSKDLGESKRFLAEIFGGEVTINNPSHVTVVVGGAQIGNGGPLKNGWPAPDVEYPHYTLLVAQETIESSVAAHGIAVGGFAPLAWLVVAAVAVAGALLLVLLRHGYETLKLRLAGAVPAGRGAPASVARALEAVPPRRRRPLADNRALRGPPLPAAV